MNVFGWVFTELVLAVLLVSRVASRNQQGEQNRNLSVQDTMNVLEIAEVLSTPSLHVWTWHHLTCRSCREKLDRECFQSSQSTWRLLREGGLRAEHSNEDRFVTLMVTLRSVAGLWSTGRAVFDRLLTSYRDDDEKSFE